MMLSNGLLIISLRYAVCCCRWATRASSHSITGSPAGSNLRRYRPEILIERCAFNGNCWLQMDDPGIFPQHYGEPCWQQLIYAGVDWKLP